jgi:hypothetical protein
MDKLQRDEEERRRQTKFTDVPQIHCPSFALRSRWDRPDAGPADGFPSIILPKGMICVQAKNLMPHKRVSFRHCAGGVVAFHGIEEEPPLC